jgi:membrane associated rhomboid family serine protease
MLNAFFDAPFSLALLLVNLLIGFYSFAMDPNLIGRMAMRPIRIRKDGEYYRLLTGTFAHAGWAHLAFNLITLYYFGPVVEMNLGATGFLIVYFGSGIAANVFAFLLHKKEDNYSAVGASGSIAGVLFAFSLLYPFVRIYLFMVLPMPAWFFAVAFVGVSIYAMRKQMSGEMGRIAHDAHLAGALAGLVLTILWRPNVVPEFLNMIGL